MNFDSSLKAKKFYKFTGPPENWLTAIKYGTWGMEEKYLEKWKNIETGDVFCIHSSATGSTFKNARSGIIGIGVIGDEFSRKENPLWLYEQEKHANRWPLLVPISEFYLFSEMPDAEIWEAPNLENTEIIKGLIDRLLERAIPLSQVPGFPPMGSFSGVSDDVRDRILRDFESLNIIESEASFTGTNVRPSTMEPIRDASEALRFAPTLKPFRDIQKKVVRKKHSISVRDNALLEKAEAAHADTLQKLLDMFTEKGYGTFFSKHVDLFAHNGQQSFLIEVKSTENKNFRDQTLGGIAQLLEYEYFDVPTFLEKQKIQLPSTQKLLVTSKASQDTRYISFINSLNIGIGTMQEKKFVPSGSSPIINL